MNKTKVCRKCGKRKYLIKFKYDKKRDYYSAKCRECINEEKRNCSTEKKKKIKEIKKEVCK